MNEPTPKRGRGRPTGSTKFRGPAARGAEACADNVRLRLLVLSIVARRLPVAFRFIDADVLKRLEADLDREIGRALLEVKHAPR